MTVTIQRLFLATFVVAFLGIACSSDQVDPPGPGDDDATENDDDTGDDDDDTGDDDDTDGDDDTACTDDCPADGDRDCTAQLDGWVLCADHDGDGCLEWSGVTSCDSDEICEDGECVDDCTEPGEECEDYDECCDDGDQAMHCCPFLHICVEDWWD
jgi:hypothetical protein